MDYKQMLYIAKKQIKEAIERHKEFPLNGYQHKALGVKDMWLQCALHVGDEQLVSKDVFELNSIIFCD